jgi:rod shape-determining protein MreB
MVTDLGGGFWKTSLPLSSFSRTLGLNYLLILRYESHARPTRPRDGLRKTFSRRRTNRNRDSSVLEVCMFLRPLVNLLRKNLAMDLGTANTLIYMSDHGIVLNEPSIVALDVRTDEILAVGAEAKRFMGREPQSIKIVRPLKDGVIADFDVTSRLISYFIRKVTRGFRLFRPQMVICIPPYITNVEKKAVIDAAREVGVKEVRLVDEAMASAIGANLPVMDAICNFVVDIGGGTSDIAVISLSGHVCGESLRVAGDEMNEAIQQFLKDKFRLLVGESMAEYIKFRVGAAVPLPEPLYMDVSGRSLTTGLPTTITVTDSDIREAIMPPIQAILLAIRRTLEKTPPMLIEDSANNGILLVGGGALIRGLDVRDPEEVSGFIQ